MGAYRPRARRVKVLEPTAGACFSASAGPVRSFEGYTKAPARGHAAKIGVSASDFGTPVGPDLASGKWLWGDGSLESITQTIANGVPEPKEHPGAMPPMGGLYGRQPGEMAQVADGANLAFPAVSRMTACPPSLT